LKQEEDVKVLVGLGCTLLQAKIYLALVKLEEANIIEVSKATNVARQEVYRVINELQNRGFVEKKLSRPVVYEALPIQETVPNLLKIMQGKMNETQAKALELMEREKNTIRKPKLQKKY